jgi:hypothetical protein
MNKRGVSRSMMIAGEIVAAALVTVLLLNNSIKWSNSESIYEDFLADDIALTIDSVFAATGNVLVSYTGELSSYSVELDDDFVLVGYKDYKKTSKEKVFPSEGYTLSGKSLSEPDKLKIAKAGKNIYLDERLNVNLDTLICNDVEEDKGKTKVLIDLSPDKKDKKPSNEICSLANTFLFNIANQDFLSGNFSTRKFIEGDEVKLNCNDESYIYPDEERGIIVSIREGKEDNDLNFVKAFIISDSEKEENSKALACMMLNSIINNRNLKDIKIDGVSVVPVDIETRGDEFPKGFFPEGDISEYDKIFVMLEIGNSKTKSGKKLLEKSTYIGESIADALIKYKT